MQSQAATTVCRAPAHGALAYARRQPESTLLWNEKAGACVRITVGATIENAGRIAPDECRSRVAEARAVWLAYSDGQADVHGDRLDRERAARAAAGYEARYWVKNISADKANSIEYWRNPTTNACVRIVFRTADGNLLRTNDADPESCTNPAPGH
jgi:hypothetical protein